MTRFTLLVCTLLLATVATTVHGANILGVFTCHAPSHLIVHMAIMNTLAERGHNVTVVSTLKAPHVHESIHNIIIPLTAEEEAGLTKKVQHLTKSSVGGGILSTFMKMFTSFSFIIEKQFDVMTDPRFTQLYEQPDTKFDLVVVGFMMNSYQVGLGAKFKAPIILSFSGQLFDMVGSLFGNPPEISYVPYAGAKKPSELMTFRERAANFGTYLGMKVYNIFMERRMSKYYKQLFADDVEMPSYADAKRNLSLIFCNSHSHSEGSIRPNVPAVIEIGGIQVKDQPNPLPEDIAKFINSSNSEVILFSLGSNLKSQYLKPEVAQNIYKTLSSLKQNVIWKWEDLEHTPGNSTNILYSKWMPQDDILAHPKVKLFITHAGKGGVAEAQYHAVPMVALPVMADQLTNADGVVSAGFGKRLDLFNLDESEFRAAILEVLENPTYAQRIREFSKLYRDRPLTARESVVYWTEYVLRHHGAPNLQSPLVKMNFVEANNMDLFGIMHLTFLTIVFFVKKLARFAWRKFKAAKANKSEQSKIKSKND